jgi:hypothetical protein
MHHLQMMIDELSRRAAESDLIALLATSRQARLYNAELARELRDVVVSLQNELDRRRTVTLAQAPPSSLAPPSRGEPPTRRSTDAVADLAASVRARSSP